jgi:hypothetical protein
MYSLLHFFHKMIVKMIHCLYISFTFYFYSNIGGGGSDDDDDALIFFKLSLPCSLNITVSLCYQILA